MAEVYGFDCYSPREIAERVESVGVTKANLPIVSTISLGVLAGGFIGLGALFATIVLSDATLSFALQRTLAGVVFSVGLILVVIAGAELFTGNNLIVMAWVAGRISGRKFATNLALVYVSNYVGAAGLAVMVALSGHDHLGDGAIGKTTLAIAVTKASAPFVQSFFKGALCNVLVCLGVWLAMAGRTVVDKVVAIVLPVAAFVAAGFEHSVANMYFFSLASFLGSPLTATDVIGNLVPVTLGNVVGGAGLVGIVYHLVYRRGARPD